MATSNENQKFKESIKRGIDPTEYSKRLRENLLKNYKNTARGKNETKKGEKVK